MRTLLLGLVIGAGLGAGGVLLLRGVATPAGTSGGVAQDATPRVEAPAMLAPPGRPAMDEQVLRRLDAIEAAVRRLEAAARRRPPSDAAPPGVTQGAGTPGRADAPSAEAVRSAWSARLDEAEAALRAVGPPDPSDVVLSMRWDDLRRARALLEEAGSLEDLRRLSEGEFHATFRWP